jgi:hypothetical protein
MTEAHMERDETAGPTPIAVTHLQQGPASILLGDVKGEALHHGLLHLTHVGQALALLDGDQLLVLGVNEGLELH